MNEIGEVLLRKRFRKHWPYPQTSLRLLSTMVWPNEDQRRDQFLDAFTARYGEIRESVGSPTEDFAPVLAGRGIHLRDLGATVLDHLDSEIEANQVGLHNAGDLLLTLLKLDCHRDSVMRGGPSVSKAKDLIEAERGGANRQRLEVDWSRSRDVAHFAAATAYFSAVGIEQTRCADSINFLTPIFADPGSVLCIGLTLQNFGLNFVPKGRKASVLSAETTWQIPNCSLVEPVAFQLEALGLPPIRLGAFCASAKTICGPSSRFIGAHEPDVSVTKIVTRSQLLRSCREYFTRKGRSMFSCIVFANVRVIHRLSSRVLPGLFAVFPKLSLKGLTGET